MSMSKADILVDCIKTAMGAIHNETKYLQAAGWIDELAELAEPSHTCRWNRDESGCYETDCGNLFEFTNDGCFKFCPYCGGVIAGDES